MFASLVYDETGNTAILRFSYDRNLVERLKVIPHDYRSYNSATKEWRVQQPYDRMAAKLLGEHFPSAVIEERPKSGPDFSAWAYAPPPPPPTCGCTADHKLPGVCANADPDLVETALRIAAKKNHPDVGGSTTQMQAINAAAERLLEAVR
jgi:hypothetical protein